MEDSVVDVKKWNNVNFLEFSDSQMESLFLRRLLQYTALGAFLKKF